MKKAVTLGSIVRDARIAKGVSQEALAALAGCSKSFISDIEADRYAPGPVTLNFIASGLGLSPDYLRRLKANRERLMRIT